MKREQFFGRPRGVFQKIEIFERFIHRTDLYARNKARHRVICKS